MGKFKILLLSLFFLLRFQMNSFGAVGCLSGNQISTNLVGYYYNTPVSTFCSVGSTTSTQYASFVNNTTTPATSCSLTFFGGLGAQGILVNYNIANCPLDDYIWFLILPMGIIGFQFMRKHELYC